MGSVNELLNQRLKKKGEPSAKMATMAHQSAHGELTSFAGLFSITELNEFEKLGLEELLHTYATKGNSIDQDLKRLISITSEVKAINNQAAILHGERIKKAHSILTHYKEGAFTAWLIATYGNRQTPYNFLHYYNFFEVIPKSLRPKLEAMPRQAVYTLATREGPLEKKKEIVASYNGETKRAILSKIQDEFPLAGDDKRGRNHEEHALQALQKACNAFRHPKLKLTASQKKLAQNLLEDLNTNIFS
jgi:hypothetical protein